MIFCYDSPENNQKVLVYNNSNIIVMSKKRSNSFHKPALVGTHRKKSELNVGKKRPLQVIHDTNYENIQRLKSISKIPKDHKEDKQKKAKNNHASPPKRKHASPKKLESHKKSQKSRSKSKSKSRRSKEYDSPSKQHDDLDYFIIAKSHKKTKRDKKNGAEVEALLEAIKDKLKKSKITEAIAMLEEAKPKDNYDIIYLKGVCYLVSGQYKTGALAFQSLINQFKPKKDVYLMLSVCFKKMEDYESTEAILNECIQKFPKYYQAYIYRGRLYVKMKKIPEANLDFQQAIYLHPERQIGYTGKGDCLRSSERYEQAIGLYDTALTLQYNSSVLLRRAICYLELEKWDRSLLDIEKLLEEDPQSSEVLYFKGLIFTKKRNFNEAIICYEQAIKYDMHKKAVARSIYEIAKIKIEQRDYYQAFYTLSRAQYLEIDIKSLQKFKTFTDGVTSLMKKNYEKGIETLNQLYKQHNLTKFLKPLFYSSRAYGLMFTEKFEEARSDFLRLEKQTSLDNANLYNKFICEGIISCKAERYEQSLAYFSKAEKVLPKRLEPNFYKAATLIKFSNKLIPKNLIQKKRQYLSSALKTVLKVPNITENNPGLFLIRGLLYLSLDEHREALKDITRSLEDSVTQKTIQFYLKGIALAELGHLQQALTEFNAAVHQDEHLREYPEIYLNRARCYLLMGESNNAFNDLQVYMSYRSTSPDIHVWAGHALFHAGSYQDAAKTYSNINNIKKNSKVLQYRASCYLGMKNLENALEDMRSILEIEQNPYVLFDAKMLESLTLCQQKQDDFAEIANMMKAFKNQIAVFGNVFKKSDYYFYKAVVYAHSRNFEKATKNFQKALNIKESDTHLVSMVEEDEDIHLNFSKSTFTNAECQYNIAVCNALIGNIPKAIKTLELVKKELVNQKKVQVIENFIAALQNEKKMMFAPASQKKQAVETLEIVPFPFENRLCSIFPEITIPFTQTQIITRFFFCLPEIKKPNITPCIDDKTLESVDVSWVETRPEAPWIKRNDQGVVFTDEVVEYEVEISESESQKSKNEEEEEPSHLFEQDQNEEGMYEDQKDLSENSLQKEQVAPPNPKDFARMMRLDQETEAKLAKLFR